MKAHGFHFESALVQRPKLARRALLVLAFFATPAIGSAQFTITCAGDGSYPSNNPLICPCGNVSVALAGEGCVNSTGFGTTLRPHPNPAIGVDTSVALDNLNLLATHPPGAGNGGLLLIKSGLPLAVGIATWAGNAADFEGMLCVGGGLRAMPGPGHPAGTRDLLHV